ncbi:arginine--tRNA ligase [Candidatus Bathyarchaeota archaeon]|nr:arginine--tRNA ligase [Candidatus Bathyarchaeota archaeon]
MVYDNPWGTFLVEARDVLEKAFKLAYPELEVKIQLDKPPSREYGDLSCSACLSLAKKASTNPMEMAEVVLKHTSLKDSSFIEKIVVSKPGYLNIYLKRSLMVGEALKSALTLKDEWGYVKTDKPLRIVIEHTSVNPIHPITIGHARNTFLGDSLARILNARGHSVSKRFYVDDVGGQVALLAYAYKLAGDAILKLDAKPDHAIGRVYTTISALVEIRKLKNRAENLRKSGKYEEARRVEDELSDWIGILSEVEKKNSDVLQTLLNGMKFSDPEEEVREILKAYELGSEQAKQLIRPIVEKCIMGFKETLERVDVSFDFWDWESEIVWSSIVRRVLNRLMKSGCVKFENNVPEFEAGRIAEDPLVRRRLGIPDGFEISSLTLLRADGLTLYPTRDIAYSILKFQNADVVINVVGFDQTLPQIQVRLALYVLGYKEQAENQLHYSYGLVKFPGFKMSSRRGRYITLDHLLDESEARAYMEVSKISPHLSEDERRRIAKSVGVSAVKYSLISVEPSKDVVFDWDRVLDFKRNSAPFIMYSYARAHGITSKIGVESVEEFDPAFLTQPLEEELGLNIAMFPQVFVEASENLSPHTLAMYCNSLATIFNSFYDSHPVIKAEKNVREARLALVEAFKITMRNALKLIGITPVERM